MCDCNTDWFEYERLQIKPLCRIKTVLPADEKCLLDKYCQQNRMQLFHRQAHDIRKWGTYVLDGSDGGRYYIWSYIMKLNTWNMISH